MDSTGTYITLSSFSGFVPLNVIFTIQEWLTPIALQQSLDSARRSNGSASAAAVTNRAGMNTAAIRVQADGNADRRPPASGSTTNSTYGSDNSASSGLLKNQAKNLLVFNDNFCPSVKNGAAMKGMGNASAVPSWRWFQRRNNEPQSSTSAPTTSRQPSTAASELSNPGSNLSPTLSRLWSSFKGSSTSDTVGSSTPATPSAVRHLKETN
jgi:hypothetical protein